MYNSKPSLDLLPSGHQLNTPENHTLEYAIMASIRQKSRATGAKSNLRDSTAAVAGKKRRSTRIPSITVTRTAGSALDSGTTAPKANNYPDKWTTGGRRKSITGAIQATAVIDDVASVRVTTKKATGSVASSTGVNVRVSKKKNPGAVSNSGRRQSPSNRIKTSGKGKTPAPQNKDLMDVDSEAQSQPESADSSPPPPTQHPTLQPSIFRIPLDTVDTKWTHLPPSTQSSISAFLSTVEVTVLSTFTSDKRRAEAQATLSLMKQKLVSQLPRIPVPSIPLPVKDLGLAPGHDVTRDLESRIRPILLQIAQLKEAIAQISSSIESRKAQLRELRVNAHDEAQLRKRRIGALYNMLREPLSDLEAEFGADYVHPRKERHKGEASMESTYDPSTDPEVLELKRKVENHLLSIQVNTKPLEGFGESIRRVRCVVDEVLERMGGRVLEEAMEV